MTMSATFTAARLMTEAEYIKHERSSERRSEYIDGELLEVPGEKGSDNRLVGELWRLFSDLLKPSGYHVFCHMLCVSIPGKPNFYYPDIVVTNEPDGPDNTYFLRAPSLIVEVVSEFSRARDYNRKSTDYFSIPTLEYYLIVEPEKVLITLCERNGEDWRSQEFSGLEETISLPKISAELPLAAIYKNAQR